MSDGMDSGTTDSGSTDSGSTDAGSGDSGWMDAGSAPSDGGRTDDLSRWSTGGGEGSGGHEAGPDVVGWGQTGHSSEGGHRSQEPHVAAHSPPPPPWPPYQPPPTQGPPRYPGEGGAFQDSPPPPTWISDPADPGYARWGIRFGGYLIDFLIFAAVTVVLVLVMRHSHALQVHLTMRRGAHRRRSFSLLPFLVSGLLYLVYGSVLCGGRRGQTVGMMAVGVRAVRDGTLERLGYGRASVRSVFEGLLRALALLTVALIVVWLLDMLFPLWDKKRQTLHDKVAGSVVLRGPPAR